MTLIVVTNSNEVLVDSYTANDMAASTATKFALAGDRYFTGAGSVHEIEEVFSGFIDLGMAYARKHKSTYNTEVLIKHRATGEIRVLRASEGATFVRILNQGDTLGVQEVFGSGWYHFYAYLSEHGDIMKAFELTCKHCPTVAGPINKF